MKFIVDIPQDLLHDLKPLLPQADVETNPDPVVVNQQQVIILSNVRTYYEDEMHAYFLHLLP